MAYYEHNFHYCLGCKRAINYGNMGTQGKWGYYCQQCSERENRLMCDCDRDSGLMCVKCRDKIIDDWYQSKNHPGLICRKCSVKEDMLQWIQWTTKPQYLDLERENMGTKRIEITVKIDGKEVPLNIISTETFEAVKALEKPKEIPVARIADSGVRRKLILKVTGQIAEHKDQYVVIDLDSGLVTGYWSGNDDNNCGSGYGYSYKNIKSL